MPIYIQYQKLQKWVEGKPVEEFKEGDVVKTDFWPTIESCEIDEQPTWKTVADEYICEQGPVLNFFNQYEKLQKYIGDYPYIPEEFKKGNLVKSDADFENIADCEANVQYKYVETDRYICEQVINDHIKYTLTSIPSSVTKLEFQFKYIDDSTFSTETINDLSATSIENWNYSPYRYLFNNGSGTTKAEEVFGQYLVMIDLSETKLDRLNTVRTMFNDCTKLEKVNFGKIDASKITETYHCFDGCTALKEITLPRALYDLFISKGDSMADWSKIKVIFND